MSIMTLGLARALTPQEWPAARPERRDPERRRATGALPRVALRRVTVRLAYPTLAGPRHRTP